MTPERKRRIVDRFYRQQHGICPICRGHMPRSIGETCQTNPNHASIEHIVPVSLGGVDESWNFTAVHRHCNSARGTGAFDDEAVRLIAWQLRYNAFSGAAHLLEVTCGDYQGRWSWVNRMNYKMGK
jgi:5-methylcytosine-specific restriction endonuclease McrA